MRNAERTTLLVIVAGLVLAAGIVTVIVWQTRAPRGDGYVPVPVEHAHDDASAPTTVANNELVTSPLRACLQAAIATVVEDDESDESVADAVDSSNEAVLALARNDWERLNALMLRKKGTPDPVIVEMVYKGLADRPPKFRPKGLETMRGEEILAYRTTVGAELASIDLDRVRVHRTIGPPSHDDVGQWGAPLRPRGSPFGVSGNVPFLLPGDDAPGARVNSPHLTLLIPARTAEGAEVLLTLTLMRNDVTGWTPVWVWSETGLAAEHHRKYFPRI